MSLEPSVYDIGRERVGLVRHVVVLLQQNRKGLRGYRDRGQRIRIF